MLSIVQPTLSVHTHNLDVWTLDENATLTEYE